MEISKMLRGKFLYTVNLVNINQLNHEKENENLFRSIRKRTTKKKRVQAF